METFNQVKVTIQYGQFSPDLPVDDDTYYCDSVLIGGIGATKNGDGRITVFSRNGKRQSADSAFEFVIWATHMSTYLLSGELEYFFKDIVVRLREEASARIKLFRDGVSSGKKWRPADRSRFSNS